MKLEEKIDQELRKIGRFYTLPDGKDLEYIEELKSLMTEYRRTHQGSFYVPPNCETCQKYHEKPTGARGWGSVL
jgi:hypothetical protein